LSKAAVSRKKVPFLILRFDTELKLTTKLIFNLKTMNHKWIILVLLLLPAFIQAQKSEQCKDIVALPKELYDSFQLANENLNNADKEIKRSVDSRNELLKLYLDCVNQPDVETILKHADESVKNAENIRKTWLDPYARVEAKIRAFIVAVRPKKVEYRYYDPYGGGKLGIVFTTEFRLDGDKFIVSVTPNQLSEPLLGH
jgi:hypothetical protein